MAGAVCGRRVLRGGEVLATHGARDEVVRWASVTKLVTALAALVAAEEGVIDLDEPAGPPGSTVRHLLAHASGLPFEAGGPTGRPGAAAIYSNVGFETLADHIATQRGNAVHRLPARGRARAARDAAPSCAVHLPRICTARSTISLLFASELQRPTLVAAETLAEATTVQFPGLAGVLPDFGRFDPNDWGLGFELRDGKSPHWTGTRNSPRTFGHFGGERHLPLGRSRSGPRARRPHRPRVR